MVNIKDLIIEIGKISKFKSTNFKHILPLLHKTSVALNVSDITQGNFFVKYTDHLCLFETSEFNRDFVFVVNATSSGRLHAIPSIPCESVHKSLLIDQVPIIKTCRGSGYYAYSYVNIKFLDTKYFEGQAALKLATGLTHSTEQSRVFNYILNTYRFKYMSEIVNQKSTSILLTDLRGGVPTSYLLKNNSLIEFMLRIDSDNILLDINRVGINEDFKIGLGYINDVIGIETITNLCSYGVEGLDCLDILGS
jgi:hypothetical protein